MPLLVLALVPYPQRIQALHMEEMGSSSGGNRKPLRVANYKLSGSVNAQKKPKCQRETLFKKSMVLNALKAQR